MSAKRQIDLFSNGSRMQMNEAIELTLTGSRRMRLPIPIGRLPGAVERQHGYAYAPALAVGYGSADPTPILNDPLR